MTTSDRPTVPDLPLPRRDDPIWTLGFDVVRAALELHVVARKLAERDRVVLYG